MKRRYTHYLGRVLAVVLVLFVSMTVNACNSYDRPADSIMPCADLWDEDNVSSTTGVYKTADFTASKDEGNTIRVWYQNTSGLNVDVTLYKCGWFSDSEVLSFTVAAGKNAFDEYSANSGTYYVKIVPDMGNTASGHLRVRQL